MPLKELRLFPYRMVQNTRGKCAWMRILGFLRHGCRLKPTRILQKPKPILLGKKQFLSITETDS